MTKDRAIARYRRWYRGLLGCYSKPYRERFAESMEQSFGDLCRERASAGRGLVGLVLWMFVETSWGILRENGRALVMQNRPILRPAILTACALLIPLAGDLFMGWHWPPLAFVMWGAIVFAAGLMFELIARKGGTTSYRVAVGLGCATGFVLLFLNAAAGIIGDGPINLLYVGVLAVGFLGACAARFQPRGLALALFATAAAQMLVPTFAFLLWQARWVVPFFNADSPHPPFHPGVGPVFGLNAVFAAMWIISGLLFRRAADAGTVPQGPGHGAGRDGIA